MTDNVETDTGSHEDVLEGKIDGRFKEFERPLRHILYDLSQPIPKKYIEQRKQGGTTLDYIPWYRAVQLLDYYAPGFEFEIRERDVVHSAKVKKKLGKVDNNGSLIRAKVGRGDAITERDMLILTGRLYIPADEGIFHRESQGVEFFDHSGFGDVASNAESMCKRRCAANWGLGLHLYQ